MTRIQSDTPSPGQDMESEAIELASKIYAQGKTLTARWMPVHRKIIGDKMTDTFVKKRRQERTPDNESRRVIERISASFFKG